MAKLLIAAKSDIIGTALADTLTQYEVHSCHTGTEALALLESLRPDMLILELSLPVISGLTVLQKTIYKPPVILALTNLVTENILQVAANAGIQDMLLLPCPVRLIIKHLEALIQRTPALEG